MITFKRQPDNTFSKAGELEPGTRSVQLQIEDRTPFGSYTIAEALAVIEDGIRWGHLKFDRYSIVPARSIDEETVARLETYRTKAKEEKMKAKLDAIQDDAEIHTELEGNLVASEAYPMGPGLQNATEPDTKTASMSAEAPIVTSSGKRKSGGMAMHSRWHVKRGIVSPTCEYCKTT